MRANKRRPTAFAVSNLCLFFVLIKSIDVNMNENVVKDTTF